MNIVKINYYKETGKHYESIKFKTHFKIFEHEEILNDFYSKYPHVKKYNLTINIKSKCKTMQNKRLIINT